MAYLPAESDSGMFGGNSNWRGPIWMPVNVLIVRALLQYYAYYGNDFTVECPTGSGQQMNLYQVAQDITRRLTSIFLRDAERPASGLRRHACLPGRSALAGPGAVLRVLSRRQRGRARRQPSDRLDGRHRGAHAPVDANGGGVSRDAQGRRRSRARGRASGKDALTVNPRRRRILIAFRWSRAERDSDLNLGA